MGYSTWHCTGEYTYDIDFSGPAYWYTVLVPVPVSLFFLINDIFNLETSFYFSFSVVVVLTRFQLTHNITVGFFDLLVFGAVAFILCWIIPAWFFDRSYFSCLERCCAERLNPLYPTPRCPWKHADTSHHRSWGRPQSIQHSPMRRCGINNVDEKCCKSTVVTFGL